MCWHFENAAEFKEFSGKLHHSINFCLLQEMKQNHTVDSVPFLLAFTKQNESNHAKNICFYT